MPRSPSICQYVVIIERSGQTLASNQSMSSYPKDGVLCFSLSSAQSVCTDALTVQMTCMVAGQTVGTSEIRAQSVLM